MPERPSEPPHSQSEFELAEPTGLAPVLLHLREQLAQQSQPVLDLVIVLLAHHEAHTGGIDRAQGLPEGGDLVVLAAQPHYQNPRVGVVHQVLQQGAGVEVVLTELGAAVLVAEQVHPSMAPRSVSRSSCCFICLARALTQPTVGRITARCECRPGRRDGGRPGSPGPAARC